MSVFYALEDRALLNNAPTEEQYVEYSNQCGVPADTLRIVYHHLRMAEFHIEEAQFGDASLNRARAKKNRERARKAYKGEL